MFGWYKGKSTTCDKRTCCCRSTVSFSLKSPHNTNSAHGDLPFRKSDVLMRWFTSISLEGEREGWYNIENDGNRLKVADVQCSTDPDYLHILRKFETDGTDVIPCDRTKLLPHHWSVGVGMAENSPWNKSKEQTAKPL